MNWLEFVLVVQEEEGRREEFSRGCLFCQQFFNDAQDLLSHMASVHNFDIGQADILVFIPEFLNKIDAQMQELVCLYCEKLFKSRRVLKEHMRKKMHKKLNPENNDWDKYYLVNYLESGKTQQDFSREESEVCRTEEESPSVWDDTERVENEDVQTGAVQPQEIFTRQPQEQHVIGALTGTPLKSEGDEETVGKSRGDKENTGSINTQSGEDTRSREPSVKIPHSPCMQSPTVNPAAVRTSLSSGSQGGARPRSSIGDAAAGGRPACRSSGGRPEDRASSRLKAEVEVGTDHVNPFHHQAETDGPPGTGKKDVVIAAPYSSDWRSPNMQRGLASQSMQVNSYAVEINKFSQCFNVVTDMSVPGNTSVRKYKCIICPDIGVLHGDSMLLEHEQGSKHIKQLKEKTQLIKKPDRRDFISKVNPSQSKDSSVRCNLCPGTDRQTS